MADTIIRAPVNTAGQTSEFYVRPDNPVTVYLYPVGDLISGETATLQREDAAGTWQSVYDPSFNGSGGVVNMDLATNCTDIMVVGSGNYRVDVADPTNAIGVAIAETRNK